MQKIIICARMHTLLQVRDVACYLVTCFLPLRSAAALASTCRRAHHILGSLRNSTAPTDTDAGGYAAQWHCMREHASVFAGALQPFTQRASDMRDINTAASTRQRIVRVVCEQRALQVLDALLFDVRFSTRHCTAYDLRNTLRDIFLFDWVDALALLERRLPALRGAQPVEPTLRRMSAQACYLYGDYNAIEQDRIQALRGWDYVLALSTHIAWRTPTVRWVLDRAVTQRAPLHLEAGVCARTMQCTYLPCVDCRLQTFFCGAMHDGDCALENALWALRALHRWRHGTEPVRADASIWLEKRVHRRACEDVPNQFRMWAEFVLCHLAARIGTPEGAHALEWLRRIDAEFPLCDEALRVMQVEICNDDVHALFCATLQRARQSAAATHISPAV